MTLDKFAILCADDLPHEVVEVPEWGGTVIVSSMSGATRDEWEQYLVDNQATRKNLKNIRATLVSFALVDETGKRLFSLAEAEALGNKSGAVLDRLAKIAQTLNKLTEKEMEGAKGN